MEAKFTIIFHHKATLDLDAEAVQVLKDATEKYIQMAANGKRWKDLGHLMETLEELQEAEMHLEEDRKLTEPLTAAGIEE